MVSGAFEIFLDGHIKISTYSESFDDSKMVLLLRTLGRQRNKVPMLDYDYHSSSFTFASSKISNEYLSGLVYKSFGS